MNRPVRSFVLRQGRTTPAQKRALEALFPRYGVAFGLHAINPSELFGRQAPLVLEIGSGMGETTAAIAKAHPELDFLAVEVHGPGIGALLNRVEAEGLNNVRLVRHDALEVLAQMVPDASLAALHLFFPDPWPKKRHHKRRIVQPEFIALVARKLVPGGIFHAATDWPDYAEHMEAALSGDICFARSERGLVERPQTKFHARGVKLGHPIRDLYFRRTGSAPEAR